MLLKGEVTGFRHVTGEYEEGDRKGEKWHFLSLEVKDTLPAGLLCSCQLRDDDPQFKEYVDIAKGPKDPVTGVDPSLLKDLKGHVVKMLVLDMKPGVRTLRRQVMDNTSEKGMIYQEQTVPTVRCIVTGIKDEGLPTAADVKW